MNGPVELGSLELAAGGTLVLLAALLSLLLVLGLQRTFLLAATRMVVQLLLVGLFLRQLFAWSSGWLSAGVVAVMLLAACHEVASRQERRLKQAWHYGVGGLPVTLATLGITLFALTSSLKPQPWYDARHLIPLVGIVLGTVMNSASVTLNHVYGTVSRERQAIEARLTLGANRYQACHDLLRRSVRAGILPLLNQMAAAGIITLPGIMTGQILAGMDPIAAARYQILLLCLLAGGGFLAACGTAYLAVWRLTDERDRLRLDRLLAAN
ncbi:ABC transporter permease [Chitinimonas sp.]|uniref:ABC transporter permease n=1 Tax=Chitinimonas sp. TaxID=1934313 RepID=UPI002F92036A